jgi:CHRD domain
MQRWGVILLAVCALGAAGCGDDDGPASPSNQPLVFTAALAAANEVPAISNAESTAAGDVTITVTPTRDAANAITGGTVAMNFQMRSLTTATTIRAAHIHTGASGVNGPIIVDSGLTAATAIPTPAGTAGFERLNIQADAATINSIVSNPAGFYFNVHTALNPGGVARGQLRTQ